jgi:predicted transcriptional regulator
MQSRGKSYVDNVANTNALSTNVASTIRSMTAHSDKSYAEIASELGVSTSTVQNYSRGRDATYELIDRSGDTIIDYD